jgi:predicted double-glycine peptidase
MKKQTKGKTLTEEEMDEIAISQAHDDDAWEEEFEVIPISKPRIVRDTNPPAKHPTAPQHR